MTLQTANRTGEIIHIKRVACRKIFIWNLRDMMWGTEELATKLKGIIQQDNVQRTRETHTASMEGIRGILPVDPQVFNFQDAVWVNPFKRNPWIAAEPL